MIIEFFGLYMVSQRNINLIAEFIAMLYGVAHSAPDYRYHPGAGKARSDQSTFCERLWRRDGTISAHVKPVAIAWLHIGQTAARISIHPPVPGAASPLVEQSAIGKNGG